MKTPRATQMKPVELPAPVVRDLAGYLPAIQAQNQESFMALAIRSHRG